MYFELVGLILSTTLFVKKKQYLWTYFVKRWQASSVFLLIGYYHFALLFFKVKKGSWILFEKCARTLFYR